MQSTLLQPIDLPSNLAPTKRTLRLQPLILPLLNPPINALLVERVVSALRQLLQVLGLAGAVTDAAV